MSITMKDIAKEAGVSISTVSHVINGTKKISEETQRLVLKAIEKYNFVPDSSAKSLRKQKTKTAALVVSSYPDTYVTGYINGVSIRARECGYHLLFVNTNENEMYERETIQLLRSKMVDGIILSPTSSNIDYLKDLFELKFPVVLVNRFDPRYPNVPRVTADDFQAGYDSTVHLIQHGHRNIGVIYSVPDVTTTVHRLEGHKAALKEHGIPFNSSYLKQGHARTQGGEDAAKMLLTQEPDITAIFVLSDLMTVGVVQAIRSMSKRIPADVALIGFGDFEAAAIADPPISNVSLPPETIGKTAFDLLLNKMNNPAYEKHISLPTSLILRKSCGC